MPEIVQSQPSPSQKNIVGLLLIIAIIAAIVGMLFYILNPLSFFGQKKQKPGEVVVKVGKENIYQKDLDLELSRHPLKSIPDTRKILIEKMIKDSVILQGGEADGIISLDSSVYNSSDKDYFKRLRLVEDVKKGIDSKADQLEGSVVSIWFFNNNKPGPLGYERGKEFAKEKITRIYNDVKSKKITIDQAGQQIQNDRSLAQVDEVYKQNAIFHFKVYADERISLDSDFDNELRSLEPGGLTGLRTIQVDVDDAGTMRDALFMFGQVKKKLKNPNVKSYDDWYAKKRNVYVVSYY